MYEPPGGYSNFEEISFKKTLIGYGKVTEIKRIHDTLEYCIEGNIDMGTFTYLKECGISIHAVDAIDGIDVCIRFFVDSWNCDPDEWAKMNEAVKE